MSIDSAPELTPVHSPMSEANRPPSPLPPSKNTPLCLLRYRPARLHIRTPSNTNLLTIIDPLASRSFITPLTLLTHFPTAVPRAINPTSLFRMNAASPNSVVKINLYVHLPLVFVDDEGEKVERWADVIVREAEGWDAPMRVLLGMDFWGGEGVGRVVWMGMGGRGGEDFEGLVFWDRGGKGGKGERERERRVEFERSIE